MYSTILLFFQDDLSVLMEGIREYLPEQNVMPLEKAISQVQDAHSSCANFADILVGALNKFRVKYYFLKLFEFCCPTFLILISRMQSILCFEITKSSLTGCSISTV